MAFERPKASLHSKFLLSPHSALLSLFSKMLMVLQWFVLTQKIAGSYRGDVMRLELPHWWIINALFSKFCPFLSYFFFFFLFPSFLPSRASGKVRRNEWEGTNLVSAGEIDRAEKWWLLDQKSGERNFCRNRFWSESQNFY